MVQIILPNEVPMSWNKLYAGQHWRVRYDEANRVHQVVRAAIDPDEAVPFDVPVDITVTACFASSPLDADNIIAKLYIDALKGWYLRGDSLPHVRSVTTVSVVGPSPYVEIKIAT